jgi:hypothetical protein
MLALFLSFRASYPSGPAFPVTQDAAGKREQSAKEKVIPKKTEDAATDSRPVEMVSLIQNFRSAPPEFASDLMIRLVETGKVVDAAWKAEVLEEAFSLAAGAQQPFRRIYASWNAVDTRAGLLASASELNMDTLSLQCRAIKAMQTVDKHKARKLTSEVRLSSLKSVACDDPLVYDVRCFYLLLPSILEASFSSAEIMRREHIYFLESHVRNLTSPVQIGPVAEVLASIKLPVFDWEPLLYALSNAVARIDGGDRAFWFVEESTDQAMTRLLRACKDRGVRPDDMLKSYRSYLVKQLSGARCADPYKWLKGAESNYIVRFNNAMRLQATSGIIPISPEEIKPAKVEGEEKTVLFWQSPRAKEIMGRLKSIRFRDGMKEFTEVEKRSSDWQTGLEILLRAMDDWRKEDEKSEEDYLHQKSIIYESLLEITPHGRPRDIIQKTYAAFLYGFDLQRVSRIEWFMHARHILRGIAMATAEDRARMIQELKVSDNEVLKLYLAEESLEQAPRQT